MEKTNQILSHPLVQVISFLTLLISGESFGGFYFTYLRHAIAEGFAYAIIGWLGVALALISFFLSKQEKLSAVLQFGGLCLMIISLVIFFLPPAGSYNIATFFQAIPLLTFVIFILISIAVVKKTIGHVKVFFVW
jgi:hypothetical protein